MKPKQTKTKRKRGVVLTPIGMKRLQQAIISVEMAENKQHLTLEQLGDRINISSKTLSRLWSLNAGVDQKTLKLCFSAFNLELRSEDYMVVSEATKTEASELLSGTSSIKQQKSSQFSLVNSFTKQHNEQNQQLESFPYPDGPVPLNSPFYIERPPVEELIKRELTQLGCVIRIRSPRQMGKSSLILRLLDFAQTQGYHTVNVNCQQIDPECLTDLNKLLRCLCWQIAAELGINANFQERWDEEVGCKLSSSLYLQNYLLNQCQNPVVLVLNEVDRFFEYPHVCGEFFALLRSWCEEARQNHNWQKLRLVVIYSTEKYISLDINRSPFNIGLPIRLGEFTQFQVEELARRHGLNWSSGKESSQLMSLVGGHPALIRIALYYICCQGMDLQQLIEDAIANGGIYRYHLWRHWVKLQENPCLAKVYTELVTTKQSLALNPTDVYKLENLGLINFEGDRILPRCELYRAYFEKQLSSLNN